MNSRDQSKLRELLLKLAQERTRPESSSVPDDHDIEQLLKLRFETDARTTSEISDRVQSRLSKILADRESSPARELELPLNIAQTSHPKPFMRQRYTWATLGAAAATLLLIWLIFAPKHTNSAIGRFTAVAGRPRISLLGTTASELAVTDGSIPLGSQIRTGNGENADITFNDGTTLRLGANTLLDLPNLKWKSDLIRPAEVRLHQGRLWAKVRHASPFAVVTPTARAEDLGTEFGLEVRSVRGHEVRTILTVKEGSVEFSNTLGSVRAGAMTESVAAAGLAPTKPMRLSSPSMRRNVTASAIGGIIYVCGDAAPNSTTSVDRVEAYDPESNTWTTKTPMPVASQFLGSAVINGKLFAVGGGSATKPLATLQIYDPSRDTWTIKKPMPTARYYCTAAALHGKLYVVGGVTGQGTAFSRMEAYDPESDSWTTKAPMPGKRSAHASIVVNGVMFVIGGGDGKNEATAVYAYDPINNKWSTKAPPPTPRALLTLATANGIIYAIGGFDKQGPVSAFEAYDIASDKWITLAPTIVRGRQALHSEVVNGTLYIISGEGSGGSTGPVASVLAVTAYTLPTLESSRGSSQDSVPKP